MIIEYDTLSFLIIKYDTMSLLIIKYDIMSFMIIKYNTTYIILDYQVKLKVLDWYLGLPSYFRHI